MDETQKLHLQFVKDLHTTDTLSNLEQIEIKYLGRNGIINQLLQKIKEIPAQQKKDYGEKVNHLKNIISQRIAEKKAELQTQITKSIDIDTSLPGIKPRIGNLHPTTIVLRKLNSFFRYLGYSVYEGPEIETNEYNFEKLNLPKDHPARDLQDTLYIQEPEILLRTHTSSVETRAMTQEKPPFRVVIPGKAYRNETVNLTNNAIFYQYEGLAIDKDLSLADLKGTLKKFAQFLYGEDVRTRFRCKYYPQVEPGAGMDIECTFCRGKGCSVCKYRGFIEVLGSGMVHPNALSKCGIDPNEWSGFAFGLGLDRLVMLQYGINDVRKLYSGEIVFD